MGRGCNSHSLFPGLANVDLAMTSDIAFKCGVEDELMDGVGGGVLLLILYKG